MDITEYLKYAEGVGAGSQVKSWISTTLKNYLEKNKPDASHYQVTEVEHVIDYLVRVNVPKINQMSYPQAVVKAEKWTKLLAKKADKIEEGKKDTKVVLDFKDGFKIVQLIGEKAYKREGYLMRNCVASYYGRDTKIYSLRDKNNEPHCTMEHGQQIKGKGNGPIHPKYIEYVVKFLEFTGMEVRDSEMANLGYANVDKLKDEIDTKGLFKKKYWYKQNKLFDKEGKEYASLDLLDYVPLIDETTLKINFNLPTFIPLAIDLLFKRVKKTLDRVTASSGDNAQLASSGDNARLASSGYYARLASSGDNARLASSGDNARLASSGYYAQLASSGDNAQLDVKGKNSVAANIGYNGKIKGVIGTWITLAEYDDNGVVKYVKTGKIDGKKLKEGVFYKLENKKFVKCDL